MLQTAQAAGHQTQSLHSLCGLGNTLLPRSPLGTPPTGSLLPWRSGSGTPAPAPAPAHPAAAASAKRKPSRSANDTTADGHVSTGKKCCRRFGGSQSTATAQKAAAPTPAPATGFKGRTAAPTWPPYRARRPAPLQPLGLGSPAAGLLGDFSMIAPALVGDDEGAAISPVGSLDGDADTAGTEMGSVLDSLGPSRRGSAEDDPITLGIGTAVDRLAQLTARREREQNRQHSHGHHGCGGTIPANWSRCAKCDGNSWEWLDDDVPHIGTPLADPHDGSIGCHIVEVDRDSSEWQNVATGLQDAGFGVINVYRIQNAAIYEQFRRKALSEAAKPWLCEQRNAYHVTRAENLKDLLLEGLDQRLAARGRFGRGLYFAEDPRKSDFYWKGSKDPSAVRMMLRTKVLLGRKKSYSPGVVDPWLRREPRGYDSVQGEIAGQKEFVVYDSNRAMIEYVITYKLPKVDCFGLPVEDGAPVGIADLTATLPTISIAKSTAAAAATATATAAADVATAVTPASGGPLTGPLAV